MPHRNYALNTWANKIERTAVGLGKNIHLWPFGQETGNRRSAGGIISIFMTPLKELSHCDSCCKEKGFHTVMEMWRKSPVMKCWAIVCVCISGE